MRTVVFPKARRRLPRKDGNDQETMPEARRQSRKIWLKETGEEEEGVG